MAGLGLNALAVLALAWGCWGWFDLPRQSHAGFDTDGIRTVTRVDPASPAQRAGLAAGDVIQRVDGLAISSAASLARLPPRRAGELLHLGIERNGENLELRIIYELLPARTVRLGRASSLVGLGFVLFPLLAFWRRPSEATRVLLLMGIGLGLALMRAPLIEAHGTRACLLAATGLLVLVGVAALPHFLLVFPHKRPWLARAAGAKLIYLPVVILWLLLVWRLVFTPPAASVLNSLTRLATVLVIGLYLLASLFLVLRNYSRTDRAQRKALAINAMLFATVAGILPVVVARLLIAFSPQSALPGQDWYFLSLALIPLAWARSAARLRRGAPPTPESAA